MITGDTTMHTERSYVYVTIVKLYPRLSGGKLMVYANARKSFVRTGDWCANETIKASFDKLGKAAEREECCSQRKKCGNGMDDNPSKHGNHWDDEYTEIDCTCDLMFFSCVKLISDPSRQHDIEDRIGLGYSKLTRPMCF
uniref:Venom protein n=1 Tax=Ampulex compressa TaxID=860918 RepID=A0A1W6EW54_AMPCP|nr:venom protein [Ampulex compressa]